MISFGEIRLKIISINIDKNKIEIKRYFGLRKIISINDNEINGFYSSLIMTKNGAYDCIYLMKENKKIAKISNQYHKNFNELSIEIKKKYKDLGFVKSGFTSEIKDIFN